MARNGSGTYSKVNTFVAGETITASGHNQNWDDLASEMTNSVAADGQTSMTGPLKLASGTAALPGMVFSSDTDTGIYRIGANNIGIAVNGSKVLDISSTAINTIGSVQQNGFSLLPVGVILPYAGSAAPTGYLLCFGQSLLRASYPDLFTAIGTTYGSADGTHFNVPDLRGRIPGGKDDMGGSAASRLTSTTITSGATTLGNTGGAESQTLTLAQLPTGITSTGSVGTGTRNLADNASAITNTTVTTSGTVNVPTSVGTFNGEVNSLSGTFTSNNTSGNAHPNVQPTIICNYIIFAGV